MRPITALALIVSALLAACDPPPGPPASQRARRTTSVPAELIVALSDPTPSDPRPSCSDPRRVAVFDSLEARVVHEYPRLRACRIRFPSAPEPSALSAHADLLRLHTDLFGRVERNHIVYLEQAMPPNDEHFGDQWGLADIEAEAAWAIAKGLKSTSVAVIDSGIEHSHPDLTRNVDTSRSYNFVDETTDANDTSGGGHGTMVAGVIGAVTNNEMGVAGVDWDVSLLALKISREDSGLAVDAAQAIRYAAAQHVDVINASWSLSDDDGFILDAIRQAENILFVAAAPTSGGDAENIDSFGGFPCVFDLPNVVCVTASDEAGAIASSWGATTVDIAAPGVRIWSTFKAPFYRKEPLSTSLAAPFVTGVAALIRSACPGIGVAELREAVLTGVSHSTENGRATVTGFRLNANLALQKALADPSCGTRESLTPSAPALLP